MLWVVTDLASHGTKREIAEFYDSFKQDEYDLLSKDEWIAFKKGAEKVEDEEVVGKESRLTRLYKFFFGEHEDGMRGHRRHRREQRKHEREERRHNRKHGHNGWQRDHRP